MGIPTISKPTKWFSNKGLSLNFPPFLSKSKSSTSLPLLPPAVPLPPLNETTKKEELRQVFHRFDHDGDGKISSEELSAYFASIGDNVSSNVVRRVIKDFDNDGDELLGFEDFVELMEGGDDGDDIKRAFEMYEGDKGCGCITPVGLQQMLGRLGDVRSYEECKAMIGVFDLDGNGVLDFNEFQHMMKGVEANRNEIPLEGADLCFSAAENSNKAKLMQIRQMIAEKLKTSESSVEKSVKYLPGGVGVDALEPVIEVAQPYGDVCGGGVRVVAVLGKQRVRYVPAL
ncbi:hypothetical protein Gotri_005119 [Gossypium trilobum]|uniref:EF-hand domain-containing protein n=1 Tax=Gossypium trilobum TaxID=34281 RepID=A0A7J9EVI6_9ROSI|nr:hypothetical protein [Gossypium trilobum]